MSLIGSRGPGIRCGTYLRINEEASPKVSSHACLNLRRGWEFWRNTKIAYGTLLLTYSDGTVVEVANPAPASLKWRPDRLTAVYPLPSGGTLTEVKFFAQNDALVDVLTVSLPTAPTKPSEGSVRGAPPARWQTLTGYACNVGAAPIFSLPTVPNASACELACINATGCVEWQMATAGRACWGYRVQQAPARNPAFDCGCRGGCPGQPPLPPTGSLTSVAVRFSGQSYVNPQLISTDDGDPPNTPTSQARNSIARFDAGGNTLTVLEKGTAYAKTAYCNQVPWGFRSDCKAKVGPMMYNGMTVALSASVPMRNVSIGTDAERRQLYNFTLGLPVGRNVSLAWAMDDDAAAAVSRAKVATGNPSGGATAAAAAVNTFLQTQVPYFRAPSGNATTIYYYSWALYFMYMLDVGKGFEALPHTQTAVNNFLGLHAYDSRVYLPMGAWIKDMERYSYGNALAWTHTANYTGVSIQNGSTPDNLGNAWISPMNCSAVSGHPEGVWLMAQHGADKAKLLAPAYEYYLALFGPNASASINPLGGIAANSATALASIATELKRPAAEVAFWVAQHDQIAADAQRSALPPAGYEKNVECGMLQYLYSYAFNQSWAEAMANYWALNRDKCWENGTVPLTLTARQSLQQSDAFEVSTIVTYWSIEGLFRHNVSAAAVALTEAHTRAMVSTYNDVVFPESWDNFAEPWGDQYYNWDGTVVLLYLERLAGISYTVAGGESALAVQDHLPPGWPHIEVVVPVPTAFGGSTSVRVLVNRTGPREKTVTVTGNPLRELRIQPWREEAGAVVGFEATAGAVFEDHSAWRFTGNNARSASVRVSWA